MKVYRTEDYLKIQNPAPKEVHRVEVLTKEDSAQDLGGLFGVLPPGQSPPYHYHQKRESIIVAISGEAIEIYDGKEYPIRAGDILFIPRGVKHTTVNRSDREFRYLEFFTQPPTPSDFIKVE
jgi:quercetin dioxygenase-like cupin family protein